MAIVRVPWLQILSTNGDGSGQQNMNQDYSVTNGFFYASPPSSPVGASFIVTHIHVLVTGTSALNMLDYGSIVGGLTNGITWETRVNGVIMDRFAGLRIKTNIDYDIFTHIDLTNFGTGAGAAQSLQAEFSFPNDYTESFVMNPGDYFGVRLRDNLTAINRHYISTWGRLQYSV